MKGSFGLWKSRHFDERNTDEDSLSTHKIFDA